MKLSKFKYIIGLFVLVLIVNGCKNEANNNTPPTSKEAKTANSKEEGQAFIEGDVSKPNVLQIAMGSQDHTTLVAAVQAADLENALVNA